MSNFDETTRRKISSFSPFLVLFIFCLFIFLRDTRFFITPRFWAEEGYRHFSFSFSHPWWRALFQPQVGYLNFWPNLSTLFATLVPLESAPFVTTFLAFVIQLVPIALILWSQSPIWKEWWRKLLGISVAFFVPLSVEVWLNTVNSFTIFGAITFLILLEEVPSPLAKRWIFYILLILGGLSGIHSCFLTPFFLFRAITEKNKERWTQTIILCICIVIQLILILFSQEVGNINQRVSFLGIATIGHIIWLQTILLFSIGYDQANNFGRMFSSLAFHDINQFRMVGRLLLIASGSAFLFLSNNIHWRKRILFLGSYAILLLLSIMFSAMADKYIFIVPGLHQRHFVAPNMIFGWMLVQGIQFPKGQGWRIVGSRLASILCIWIAIFALYWGALNFRAEWTQVTYWPDWKQEVSLWRADPTHELTIQPEGWKMILEEH